MYQDWEAWYSQLSEQAKSDVRTSEQRFVADEEFRNAFIGKFNEIFATSDLDKDELLNQAEFTSFQDTWSAWTASQSVPKNWDPSQAEKWYAFFNAEKPDTEGVSAGDIMTGTMKYTDKIRTHIGMQAPE